MKILLLVSFLFSNVAFALTSAQYNEVLDEVLENEGIKENIDVQRLKNINIVKLAKAFKKANDLYNQFPELELSEYFNNEIKNDDELKILIEMKENRVPKLRSVVFDCKSISTSFHALVYGQTKYQCITTGPYFPEFHEYALGVGLYYGKNRNTNGFLYCLKSNRKPFKGLGGGSVVSIDYGIKIGAWIGNGACLIFNGTTYSYGADIVSSVLIEKND